jgi:hypothetical protein
MKRNVFKEIRSIAGISALTLVLGLTLAGCGDPGGGAPTLQSISVSAQPSKTAYAVGEGFSAAGLVVRAVYSNASSAPVTGYTLTWDGSALTDGNTAITAAAGSKTISVDFQGKTVDFTVTFTPFTPTRTNASIKNTFGITSTGVIGVTNTFIAVHTYVTGKTTAELASDGIIQLGDYIDLEGGMTVSGGISHETVAYGADLGSGHGNLLRLIVVGINSFNASGTYTVTDNGTDAHLVFQFQNVAFTHRMEVTNINTNGYAGSEMKTYLLDNFLPGLTAAGVPDSVLWAPTRSVANKGSNANGTHTVTDKLWLPTDREMFGARTYSVDAHETAANQARLEYYTSNALRVKYNASNAAGWYWQASPHSASSTHFCTVGVDGYTYNNVASSVGGCAPAFSVK